MAEFFGDSGEYEFITDGIQIAAEIDGICVEIGTRRGLSLKHIFDAVMTYSPLKTVISIDPFGCIPYIGREQDGYTKLDYNDQMKHECMMNVYQHLSQYPVYFQFYNMTDKMFFRHFESGIPVYKNEVESIEDKYSFVFYDGPHYIDGIIEEMSFFLYRTNVGGVWVFDDITIDFYDHSVIDKWLLAHGFEHIKSGMKKAIYRKAASV